MAVATMSLIGKLYSRCDEEPLHATAVGVAVLGGLGHAGLPPATVLVHKVVERAQSTSTDLAAQAPAQQTHETGSL